MNCPMCRVPTDPVFTKPAIIVDQCHTCKGIWFDEGEIYAFSMDPTKLAATLRAGLIEPHPSTISCPRCFSAMVEGGLFQADLQIDLCVTCRGLWFERGELRKAFELAEGLEIDPGAEVQQRAPMPEKPLPGPRVAHAPSGPRERRSLSSSGSIAGAMPIPPVPELTWRATSLGLAIYGVGCALLTAGIAQTGVAGSMALGVALALAFVVFLLAPALTDFLLARSSSISWGTLSSLPPTVQVYFENLCKKEGIPPPAIGILADDAPNAFSYGHAARSARLVVTRGLIDVLTPGELETVLAHEIGHVIQNDLAIMTALELMPLACFAVYRLCRRSRTGSRDKSPLGLIALPAYVGYSISRYLAAVLTRLREYHADRYATKVTQNPSGLASALLKVARGMVNARARAVNSYKESKARGEDPPEPSEEISTGVTSGIFDPRVAQSLVASAGFSDAEDHGPLVSAMRWDMWNPWSLYYEWHSSHPHPANRLDQLGRLAFRFGQRPCVLFDRRKPQTYWDTFAADCFFLSMPWLAAAGGAVVGHMAGHQGFAVLGLTVASFGFGAFVRSWFTYPLQAPSPYSVSGLLSHVKVSQVRAIPVVLEGKVIARGIPGQTWDEDLLLQDRTGVMLLDHRQPLSLISWLFGMKKTQDLDGKDVRATGWYRRAPVPFVELATLVVQDKSRAQHCHVAFMSKLLALATMVAGVALTLASK